MWFWVLYRFKNDYKVFLVRRATNRKQLRDRRSANGNDSEQPRQAGRFIRASGNFLLLSRHFLSPCRDGDARTLLPRAL
jgi:hypothetical protein